MQTFQGVWPALVTPAAADGGVSVPVLRDLVDYLLDKRVDGFYVCGSTGEGIFMPAAQRELALDTVLQQVRGRVPVIAHVGCVALGDALRLARHAAEAGAAGVSSILPPYYQDQRSLAGYFQALADVASGLPVLSYIFGGPVDAVELLRELMRIPNLAGTKYTGPNMYEFSRIVGLREDDWTVFSGMDEQCVFAAMSGSSGNIGSTLNVMPGVYRRIRQACESGDLERAGALQQQANRLTTVLLSAGFAGALREALRMLGFDCGEPRLPQRPLQPAERERVRAQIDAAGLRDLAAM